MRTREQVKENIELIQKLKEGMVLQIKLLEGEYQDNARKCMGKPSKDFTKLCDRLIYAWKALNTLQHMEENDLDNID